MQTITGTVSPSQSLLSPLTSLTPDHYRNMFALLIITKSSYQFDFRPLPESTISRSSYKSHTNHYRNCFTIQNTTNILLLVSYKPLPELFHNRNKYYVLLPVSFKPLPERFHDLSWSHASIKPVQLLLSYWIFSFCDFGHPNCFTWLKPFLQLTPKLLYHRPAKTASLSTELTVKNIASPFISLLRARITCHYTRFATFKDFHLLPNYWSHTNYKLSKSFAESHAFQSFTRKQITWRLSIDFLLFTKPVPDTTKLLLNRAFQVFRETPAFHSPTESNLFASLLTTQLASVTY
jgi:hypothetical protein